jgi:uncharacterized protein
MNASRDRTREADAPRCVVRRLPTAAVVSTLAVVFLGHVLFWTVESVSNGLDAISAWSDQLIQPTLTINVVQLVVLAGLWFLAFGVRVRDLGIQVERLRAGLGLLVGGWLCIQLIRVSAAIIVGHGFEVDHGEWLVGAFAGQVLGNALVEEIVHRGLVLPQLYDRMRAGAERWRLVRAVVVSSSLFALTHILMLVNRGYAAHEVVGGLVVLALMGCFFAAIYLRTSNLFVVIAVHALTNVSGDIVSSPIDGRALAFALGAGCIIWWPRERN